jgi:hypothetical protein
MNRSLRSLVALGLLLGIAGQAEASFITAPAYAVGATPGPVAVGDFNGDGFPDLPNADFDQVGDA